MQNFYYSRINSFLNFFSLLKVKKGNKLKNKKNKIDPIYNDWKVIGKDMEKGIIRYDREIKK